MLPGTVSTDFFLLQLAHEFFLLNTQELRVNPHLGQFLTESAQNLLVMLELHK